MVDYYGLGVLTPGMGIFHLVFSYSGKLTLSVLADRDIMPDPEFYHDCLVASYEELYRAALRGDAGKQTSADVSPKRRGAGAPAGKKGTGGGKASVRPKKARPRVKAKSAVKPPPAKKPTSKRQGARA